MPRNLRKHYSWWFIAKESAIWTGAILLFFIFAVGLGSYGKFLSMIENRGEKSMKFVYAAILTLIVFISASLANTLGNPWIPVLYSLAFAVVFMAIVSGVQIFFHSKAFPHVADSSSGKLSLAIHKALSQEYSEAVWLTPGAGIVKKVDNTYVFTRSPERSSFKTGEVVPKGWRLSPFNDLARKVSQELLTV